MGTVPKVTANTSAMILPAMENTTLTKIEREEKGGEEVKIQESEGKEKMPKMKRQEVFACKRVSLPAS